MGYCLWEPKRIKNAEQDCQRLNKAKGKICPMRVMKIRGKRRHLITDYSHQMPKLHCPWDDEAKKRRNEISPGLLYHGLHSTDVTERLKIKPPRHASHPSLSEQPPDEYHGRQAQDVTEMYTFASRGKRPPSRDHYYGREATDISEFLRIIPPVAKEGDENNEFFGRPKSDVTDYNLFPLRTIDTNSRTEAARPLGRCPPGPMCDYMPLIRDKEGKLIRPQPPRPPSPLCESGTHELPLPSTLVQRHHQPESEQQFVPGAGGILAQIVPGLSRSEAKKPVGRGVAGVMADYVQLVRDETGKAINAPDPHHWDPPRQHSPHDNIPVNPICPHHQRKSDEAVQQYANRDAQKRPLGKVPVGVMHDFVPNPAKGKHKHTTLGYWALPSAYPPSPPFSVDPDRSFGGPAADHKTVDVCHGSADAQLLPSRPMSRLETALNATDNTLKEDVKKKLIKKKKDQRRNQVCEMHEPGCPLAAEQGHVGSCISHPAVSSYVKWPKDGELKLGPCKKHGGRTGIFSVRGSPCSSVAAAPTSGPASRAASPCDSALGPSDGSCNGSIVLVDRALKSDSKARSPPCGVGSNMKLNSLANQSPLKPDTACPRAACQCIRVANKGTGPPAFGYVDSISRLDPKFLKKKKPNSAGSVASSAFGRPPSWAAGKSINNKSAKRPPKKKSMAFVTEETSPQHFRVPYFGLAQTYVTNPAVSPNLTPPIQRAHNALSLQQQQQPNQENMPQVVGDVPRRSCSQADVCKHHQDGKTAWFGRSKTYVTDPAVSPTLTPPCFQAKFR